MSRRELLKVLSTLADGELAQLYKNVFDSVDGQLVLEDLRHRCYIYTDLPLGEPGQRGEGRRNVVTHIETQLSYDPEEAKDATEEVD